MFKKLERQRINSDAVGNADYPPPTLAKARDDFKIGSQGDLVSFKPYSSTYK